MAWRSTWALSHACGPPVASSSASFMIPVRSTPHTQLVPPVAICMPPPTHPSTCHADHAQLGGGGSTLGQLASRRLRSCTTACSQRHRSRRPVPSRSRRGSPKRCARRSLLAMPGQPSTWAGQCQASNPQLAGRRAGPEASKLNPMCRSFNAHIFVVVLTLKQTFGFNARSIGVCPC